MRRLSIIMYDVYNSRRKMLGTSSSIIHTLAEDQSAVITLELDLPLDPRLLNFLVGRVWTHSAWQHWLPSPV